MKISFIKYSNYVFSRASCPMSRSRRPCLPNQKLRLWVTANTCGNANTNLLLLLYVTDLTRCKGCFWEEWCRAESQETSGPGSSYQKMSGLGQTWRTARKPGHDLIFNRNDESITRLEKKQNNQNLLQSWWDKTTVNKVLSTVDVCLFSSCYQTHGVRWSPRLPLWHCLLRMCM